MPSDAEIQVSFLSWIKETHTKKGQSFVDELANILALSKDSAYRRMRGESLLSFGEISRIAQHFGASVDSFLELSSTAVRFDKTKFEANFSFKGYLGSILEILEEASESECKRMIWLAKDVPILHYFQFPKLTSFKSFFWQRTILGSKENLQYDPALPDQELLKIAGDIWKAYAKLPSAEVWSEETINITLRQIDFYRECEIISLAQANELIDEFEGVIALIKEQAKQGRKLTIAGETFLEREEIAIYYNEIAIADNTIYFDLGDHAKVYLTYNVLNILKTSDNQFCKDTRQFVDMLLQKSIPISASSEKERARFFNLMEKKISGVRDKINN